MNTLGYLQLAAGPKKSHDYSATANVALVTNFTDELFKKLLVGMCLAEDIDPSIYTAPYKQYHFLLKDQQSDLYRNDADSTFVMFDLNPYLESEFASMEHFASTLQDLGAFCGSRKGMVVIATFLPPHEAVHGLKGPTGRLWEQISRYNRELREFANANDNIYLIESNTLAHGFAFSEVRDLRNLYAYDMPFAQEFSARVCARFTAYIRARLGRAKKCLVLDLDNVLWGGIVGEVGPEGVELGEWYPGSAYRAFQRSLLDLYERGVLLAINSKNNTADVDEVFERNPHMLLRKEHFAAIRVNWEDKATNLDAIAEELNIGVDALVFLDDDPHNRELVRRVHPEVLVPDFSLPPEGYVQALLELDVFDPLSVSDEDNKRTAMYAAERERKQSFARSTDLADYLRTLNIQTRIMRNEVATVPRVSQLTQKTNQFNLTTRRYVEHEVRRFIDEGAAVYAAEVTDKFGNYGITNAAIVRIAGHEAHLDTYLMSCRVIGRNVEFTIMEHIAKELKEGGVTRIRAEFIATSKNDPAKEFLLNAGFAEVARDGNTALYERTL